MSGHEVSNVVQLNERGYYEVGKGIRGARTDQELVDAIIHREHNTVLVKYGLPWCKSCRAILPQWVNLTRKFQGMDYVIASVENMKEAVKDLKYTPHFAFYRNGRKVDEFFGDDVQRLRDRMWLHNDTCPVLLLGLKWD